MQALNGAVLLKQAPHAIAPVHAHEIATHIESTYRSVPLLTISCGIGLMGLCGGKKGEEKNSSFSSSALLLYVVEGLVRRGMGGVIKAENK